MTSRGKLDVGNRCTEFHFSVSFHMSSNTGAQRNDDLVTFTFELLTLLLYLKTVRQPLHEFWRISFLSLVSSVNLDL